MDSDVLAGSLASERSLPFFHTPVWSKALSQTRAQVATLQKVLSCVNDQKPFPQRLRDQFAHICQHPQLSRNKQLCRHQLRQSKEVVAKIVKQSFAQREQELQDRISHLETSLVLMDRKRASGSSQMLACEKRAQVFKKLKSMRQTGAPTGLARIEVPRNPEDDPKQCQDWQLIDIPSEVLHHLQTRNRRYFGQAHGSPFTIPPLSAD
jgi:hypothetical protein